MKCFKDLLLEAKRKVKSISSDELKKLIVEQQNLLLLDVRELDEYQECSIDGARLLPRGMLELYIEQIVPSRTQRIIVYCDNGSRSSLACVTLQVMGYENVISLLGGIKAWMDKDFYVTSNTSECIEYN